MITTGGKQPADFQVNRFRIDLSSGSVAPETVVCEDLEDVFGGIARGYKLLEGLGVDDAYDPSATLLMNIGLLSGSDFMTGLRTYFMAYSPLKRSLSGKPSSMWSAGSGKFGTKLRYLGVEEVIFTGRCEKPSLLHISLDENDIPVFQFEDAEDLVGLKVNAKIQTLHKRYPDAHFAVIGPSGENYQNVRYGAIAISTENQLKSGDPKSRYCGRGGMGSMMGSKNLLAIVADTPDKKTGKAPPILKEINTEIARGKGSAKFREKDKHNGGGGTWGNVGALQPLGAFPEMNFIPIGDDSSAPLIRDNAEKGPWVIKDESCFRCGIRCHKNVFEKNEEGKAGKFRAKIDYEPLDLLSANIGIFDIEQALDLVALVDEMGMDSISCGVVLSYVMEYNRQNPDSPIADGLSYGDYEKTLATLEKIGTGQCELIGQGVLRLAEQVGEKDYAMHCKGVELPAYLPQTNPGYPWALAGGHMSMRTFLLLVFERETDVDYWVDAITNRGIMTMRDDFLGVCKFCGMGDEQMCQAIEALSGLEIDPPTLQNVIMRTYLRGYRQERQGGFTDDDYNLPAISHNEYPQIDLPYFITPEFFADLKQKVTSRFDELLVEQGLS